MHTAVFLAALGLAVAGSRTPAHAQEATGSVTAQRDGATATVTQAGSGNRAVINQSGAASGQPPGASAGAQAPTIRAVTPAGSVVIRQGLQVAP